MFKRIKTAVLISAASVFTAATGAAAQTPTTFTYQGLLKQSGQAIDGTADLKFFLFNGAGAGATQIGSVLTIPAVDLEDGLFTVNLDFGAGVFDGEPRWLEIAVRWPHDPTNVAPFTTLAPRQSVTAAPYAMHALSIGVLPDASLAGNYSNAVNLSNVGNSFVGNGSGLLNLNASQVTSGVLSGSVLAGAYGSTLNFSNANNTYAGNGAALTALNASNITSGSLNTARLPSSGDWALGSFFTLDGSTLAINPSLNYVGVGIANPFAKLHVHDDGPSGMIISSGSDSASIILASSGFLFTNPPSLYSPAGGDDLRFMVGGADRMHFATNGNVGVGTTAPANRLSVVGNADVSGNLGLGVATTFNRLSVSGNADVSGRLGVGTNAPATELHLRDATNTPLQVSLDSGLSSGQYAAFDFLDRGTLKWGMGKDNANDFYIDAAGAGRRLTIFQSSGNFAIGTGTATNPHSLSRAVIIRGENTGSFPGSTGVVMQNPVAGSVWSMLADTTGGLSFLRTGAGSNKVTLPVLQLVGGSDIAEPFNVTEHADQVIEPGMVVSIDPDRLGELRVATEAYDRTVAGVLSGANGVNTGLTLTQEGTVADGKHPVALTGRVWCWCDADMGGPITAGDLLTTSETPGHAMRASDFTRAHGAIIGKAMSPLERGRGLVMVLVSLQ